MQELNETSHSTTTNVNQTDDLSQRYTSTVIKYIKACPTVLDVHTTLLVGKLDTLLRSLKDNKDKEVQGQINTINKALEQLLEHHRLLKECFYINKRKRQIESGSDQQVKADSKETIAEPAMEQTGPPLAKKNKVAHYDLDETSMHNKDTLVSSPQQSIQSSPVNQKQGVSFAIIDIDKYVAQKLPPEFLQFKQRDRETFKSCKSRFEQLLIQFKLGSIAEVLSIFQFIKSLNVVTIQQDLRNIVRWHYGDSQESQATHIHIPDTWREFSEIILPYEDSIEQSYQQQFNNESIVPYHPTRVNSMANFQLQTITAMAKYQKLSQEEIRLQDYQNRAKIYRFRDDFCSVSVKDPEDGLIYHLHSLTAIKRLQKISFEELRVRQYRQMRNREKKFPLSEFMPTCVTDTDDDNIDVFQDITAMNEYQHLSVEEIRLQDYREGRGPSSVSVVVDNGPSKSPWTVFGKSSSLITPRFVTPPQPVGSPSVSLFGQTSSLNNNKLFNVESSSSNPSFPFAGLPITSRPFTLAVSNNQSASSTAFNIGRPFTGVKKVPTATTSDNVSITSNNKPKGSFSPWDPSCT